MYGLWFLYDAVLASLGLGYVGYVIRPLPVLHFFLILTLLVFCFLSRFLFLFER